ncbi:UNVERIFIED_ORG: precorrin-6Y C5,15-methyltransferase (decarboxylating) [Nocardia globerula]|uniref:Precorrin-6Y C5,15-methyltransferase (Decarboxylating) n=1 Tax=Nocardia globerula TaxID=1818 RepID=A0A652YN28_NOCGL|nr:bifunctional cobalt-precorrin-7 (C(5))-methyltransferase/cobalt-precorrin-6B (C(15))-methyltransferase [Rhodococcus globerulus]NMD62456.1 bifunctional cobalt-precorrin-7 (C(5))-methyltransferase/cobalt-precorrin-6B (C(15))-methyltransferase [Nocardia globerula]PVX65439.1 precorrin-6Y C5,15-methyltransferase (decarboxylating) [Rhodococcus globerulus]
MTADEPVVVVGLGADGWEGLSDSAKSAVLGAQVLMGSSRQLDLIPLVDGSSADRIAWPTPMLPALPGLFDAHAGRRICVLASGDPMFHGIGATLVRVLGADNLRVISYPSSIALASARMGWASADAELVSLVNRDATTVLPSVTNGARLLVLSNGRATPGEVAEILTSTGFGRSMITVLGQLGGAHESRTVARADQWDVDAADVDPLNVLAVECVVSGAPHRLTRVPGLPDAAYSGDGQMTKQEIRALTICALAPAPGEYLWDVGGGSGTVAIEWMRTHPRCTATSFEQTASRISQIVGNARALGVPSLDVLGRAPESFAEVTRTPDAIFIGGGVTQPGMLDACWDHLEAGGRLVANAVTAESEALLLEWFTRFGGTLRRLQIQRAEPLGTFNVWRPQLPVVQWSVTKTEATAGADADHTEEDAQ